jgi:hypothetical protein
MLWDLSGDDDEGSLLTAIHDSLGRHRPGGHGCE